MWCFISSCFPCGLLPCGSGSCSRPIYSYFAFQLCIMQFSSAVVFAFIACGGLASAQYGVGEPRTEKRDLLARDAFLIMARPQFPTALQRPTIPGLTPATPISEVSLAAIPAAPLTRPNIHISHPGMRFSNIRRVKSLAVGQIQSMVPEVLLRNSNGYGVTTAVTFRPNKPPPVPHMARQRVPGRSIIRIPLRKPQMVAPGRLVMRPNIRIINRKGLLKAIKRQRALALRKEQAAAAMRQMKIMHAIKKAAASERAFMLNANE